MKIIQQNNVVIKGVVFMQTIKKNLVSPNRIAYTLLRQVWKISKFNQENWSQIFQKMISSNVLRLLLGGNNNSNIIKDIKHVNFTQLKKLSLQGNFIRNIQAIQEINCMTLQIVDLAYNQICNIDCLYPYTHTYAYYPLKI